MDRAREKQGDESSGELRVLYVIPGEDSGLSMSFSRRQASAVSALGVDVRSFFLRSRTSPVEIWKELRRLRREIREFTPDVVHAHFGTVTAFVSAVASRTPLIVTFHGSDLNPAPGISWLRSRLGHMLSHFAARRASQIICVSPQLCDRVAAAETRMHVVPCGVNLKQFHPMPKKECREKLGWAFDDKIVLFNARTDPMGKRLDLAEATADYAKLHVPNLRLHVFRGNTPPDEMPLYYSAADALLMTSDYEGSPMVVKEAMACNLPVVSVDVGDVAERLAGVSHSTVVGRDPEALCQALVKVLRTECRSDGREFAHDLSEESIAAEIVSIYRLAADSGTSPLVMEQRNSPPMDRANPYRQAM